MSEYVDKLLEDLNICDDNLSLALLELITNKDLEKYIAALMLFNNKIIACRELELNDEFEEYLEIQNKLINLLRLFLKQQKQLIRTL